MTPRDNLPASSPSEQSAAGTDVLTERATAQPTLLSTVWEGPPDAEALDGLDSPSGELGVAVTGIRSRVAAWLLAPATRRRTLLITMAAAVICSSALAAVEMGDRSPAAPADLEQVPSEATQGSLSSRAVAADESGRPELVRESRDALSADERVRLVVDPDGSDGSWMLEAQVVDPADSAVVRFTVNGAVVEEVGRAPYRLLLSPELLATLPSAVGEGQPLIVTASALWPGDGDAASPATVVIPN